jgi:hypothetical protein
MARPKYLLGIGTIFAALLLNGCAGVGLTLFGVGAGVTAGTSVAYTLDGIAYRTFTAPLPRVESATRTALDRMGIKVEATAKIEQGKAIKAVSNDRDIEIELEMVTPRQPAFAPWPNKGFSSRTGRPQPRSSFKPRRLWASAREEYL